MEQESGDETNEDVDNDDMETPKEGGDVPSASISKKATTLRKDTSPIVKTTSITQRSSMEVLKKLDFEEMVTYALSVANNMIRAIFIQ